MRKDPGPSTFLTTIVPPPLLDASAIHRSQLHELSLPVLNSTHPSTLGIPPLNDKNDLPFLDDTQHSERVALRERGVLLADAMLRLRTCSGSTKRRLDALAGRTTESPTVTLWRTTRSPLNLSIPPLDIPPALHPHVLRGEVLSLRQSILPSFPQKGNLDTHRVENPASATQSWHASKRFPPSPLATAAKNLRLNPSSQPDSSKMSLEGEIRDRILVGGLPPKDPDEESDISQASHISLRLQPP